MTVSPDYLRYPMRRKGLDHDWFEHCSLPKRRPVQWPGGAKIALWLTVPIELFPLDAPAQPFRPLGSLDRPYPDLWDFSNRDYGNRIGVYRIMRVLDRFGIRATAAMNSDIALRYPRLLQEVTRRDWEIMASGVNMGRLLHAGLSREAEQAIIAESVTTLRKASSREITGWHSPAHSQSMHTLELVAAAGLSYVADWINDDLPYAVQTPRGSLCALPLSYELSDRKIMLQHDRMIEDYERQVLAAFAQLQSEADTSGGRILSLVLTPWVIGYPHRIAGLERILSAIMAAKSIWPATGAELAQAFRAQEKARS